MSHLNRLLDSVATLPRTALQHLARPLHLGPELLSQQAQRRILLAAPSSLVPPASSPTSSSKRTLHVQDDYDTLEERHDEDAMATFRSGK
jgi:hypothetical protein